jgi:hypothetical protein
MQSQQCNCPRQYARPTRLLADLIEHEHRVHARWREKCPERHSLCRRLPDVRVARRSRQCRHGRRQPETSCRRADNDAGWPQLALKPHLKPYVLLRLGSAPLIDQPANAKNRANHTINAGGLAVLRCSCSNSRRIYSKHYRYSLESFFCLSCRSGTGTCRKTTKRGLITKGVLNVPISSTTKPNG